MVTETKIRVTYTAEEQERKQLHETAVKGLFPDVKVQEATPKDGFLHTVLTIPKPKIKKSRDKG